MGYSQLILYWWQFTLGGFVSLGGYLPLLCQHLPHLQAHAFEAIEFYLFVVLIKSIHRFIAIAQWHYQQIYDTSSLILEAQRVTLLGFLNVLMIYTSGGSRWGNCSSRFQFIRLLYLYCLSGNKPGKLNGIINQIYFIECLLRTSLRYFSKAILTYFEPIFTFNFSTLKCRTQLVVTMIQ